MEERGPPRLAERGYNMENHTHFLKLLDFTPAEIQQFLEDRKSTRLNSSH